MIRSIPIEPDETIKANWRKLSSPEWFALLELFYTERNSWEKLAEERYIKLGIMLTQLHDLNESLNNSIAEERRLPLLHQQQFSRAEIAEQTIADLSMLLLASFQKPAYVNDGPEYWTDSEIDAELARLADERKERR